MKVTISQLRILEAVARTRSFSKAAKELGITQPSVSTQLRALEKQSRAQLLVRNGHDIRPSRLARMALPKVRALVSLAEEVEGLLREQEALGSGLLRVGYSTYQYAMPTISRFMARYPGIKIEARSMASLDLLDLLDRGEIDAAFVTAQEAPEGLCSAKLFTCDIVLMLPADHALAGRGEADWHEIEALPLIRRERTSSTRILFDRAAARAGVKLSTVLDLGSWGSLRAAVEAGIGGCVALRGEVEPNDRVSVLTIRDPALWASHFVACASEMREVAAVDALFREAEEVSEGCE
ncbi:MAG: LysR family transcriptional regulator [Pseudomonadota bacterium]